LIAAYVSGHGYGHATRTGEVLRVLREQESRLSLAVCSSAPEFLFRRAVPGEFDFRSLECDVGLAQTDAVTIDAALTLDRLRAFAAGWEDRLAIEAAWLRRSGVRLVLGDIPPLAFAAAVRAGVPSVALGNFSWDWIYRRMAARHPGFEAAAAEAAAAYAEADLLLRLPFAGDMSVFPRSEDIPLVARRPGIERGEVRRRLRIDEARTVVLVSFGGFGLPGFSPRVLGGLGAFLFLAWEEGGELPDNVRSLDRARLEASGLGYADLLGACDVVVTKPGYGIVSDAIAAGVRLVYTERRDFPEYPILVRQMPRYLPSIHVSNADMMEGRLGSAIEAVLARPFPATPDLGGARVAARRMLERVGGG
jgi:L-arabinokinase